MTNDTLEVVKKKRPADCQWCGTTRELVKSFLICLTCDRVPTYSGGK
jgi:ribosomal protein S14